MGWFPPTPLVTNKIKCCEYGPGYLTCTGSYIFKVKISGQNFVFNHFRFPVQVRISGHEPQVVVDAVDVDVGSFPEIKVLKFFFNKTFLSLLLTFRMNIGSTSFVRKTFGFYPKTLDWAGKSRQGQTISLTSGEKSLIRCPPGLNVIKRFSFVTDDEAQ
jgi:hypothetical protein